MLTDSKGSGQTADAQADLGLRISPIPEDTISHGGLK